MTSIIVFVFRDSRVALAAFIVGTLLMVAPAIRLSLVSRRGIPHCEDPRWYWMYPLGMVLSAAGLFDFSFS